MKIGNAISLFKHRGHNLSMSLLQLGEKIIDNMDESFIYPIFMDRDFLDRSTLKLITDFEFEPLLKDDKVSALLDKLWIGNASYQCDGRITDYSKLTFLANSPIKMLPGQTIEFKSLLGENFQVFINQESFNFQYKFRKSSIEYIFMKEMFSTIIIALLLLMICYTYLTEFSMMNFQLYQQNMATLKVIHENDTYWELLYDDKIDRIVMNLTDFVNYEFYYCTRMEIPALIAYEQQTLDDSVENARKTYSNWNMYGIFISLSMFFYVITKFIFNVFATYKLQLDKWSLIDIFCAFTNISCLYFLSNISGEDVINPLKTKQYYNVLTIMVVISTFMRFGGQMFVISQFSKLLVTINKMLGSAGTFISIMSYYLLTCAFVVIAVFGEKTINYSNLINASRSMFDQMMGMYDYSAPDTK